MTYLPSHLKDSITVAKADWGVSFTYLQEAIKTHTHATDITNF